MTIEANTSALRMAHAHWLRDKAGHFRRIAAGAIPLAAVQEIEALALRYERLAAALEDGIDHDVVFPAAGAAD